MKRTTEMLEKQFLLACNEAAIRELDRRDMLVLLGPLRTKHRVMHEHYRHSLRVALYARGIGRYLGYDQKIMLFSGALHDIGKAQTPVSVLGKTEAFTEDDMRIMREHVMDSYRLLRDRFDFTAEVILWHHRFQERGYPKVLPPPLHEYRDAGKSLIVEYGRILALADVYDALHRANSKHASGRALSDAEVFEKMIEYNPDRVTLVRALYSAGIFVR